MADLRAALGRGMSTSEAKAWVQALDRLGEGLDGEEPRDSCLVSVSTFALDSGVLTSPLFSPTPQLEASSSCYAYARDCNSSDGGGAGGTAGKEGAEGSGGFS